MIKWILLVAITVALILFNFLYSESIGLHDTFMIMVFFFAIQTFVLFRLDNWAPKDWAVQVSLVKIVLRFLLSLTFIAIMIYNTDDPFNLVVQFICLYLIFMVFEIAIALTNLRRN